MHFCSGPQAVQCCPFRSHRISCCSPLQAVRPAAGQLFSLLDMYNLSLCLCPSVCVPLLVPVVTLTHSLLCPCRRFVQQLASCSPFCSP
jgi:hypothetical protein